jgi:hypothetical protein
VNARDIARDLTVLKVLSERIREAKALLEQQARELMEPVDRMAVKMDGELLGTVTVTNGRRTARVVDDAAFLRWVKEHHPSEVHTVESVRPAFIGALLDASKGFGDAVDPVTGETGVPGVVVSTGDPYPMIRLTADADAVVSVAWQAGRLTLPGAFLPALEPAPDSP